VRSDYVQRFLFESLDIRGRLVCLTGAWTRMLEGRDYSPRVAELLGHTTALAVLLGANLKDRGRVTVQAQGGGALRLLVADCDAQLRIRGMASCADGPGALPGQGKLAVTLDDAASGQLYQSVVALEGSSLGATFERYLAQSEQRPSYLHLLADRGALCGLLLEKLPGADARDADGWNRVMRLAATLRLAESVDAQPYDLLTRLFPEELLRVFRLHAVAYHCPEDAEKVRNVLRSLGRDELQSILAERGEIIIRNEMSNREYRFDPRDIARLFAAH
jgi:molecular chaperone Hsp33